MIGTVQVKVQAAMPNHPLQPLFAFKGSPSSMRIMDVPKKIGEWEIKEVSVLVKYPDNTQAEKVAVRTGNVWIATVEGCETTGRVVKGYEVLASGIDENGNDVSGYVLGSGDVFILERDSSIPEKGVEKFYVKFCETLPANPQKGDIVDDGGTVKMYDGTKWIDMGGGSAEEVGDATLTIKKNGTNVGSFTANSFLNKTIDIPVPSTTNDLVNDSGFITSTAIPSTVSSFENDVGYITAEAIPSQISSFENDVGYLTSVSWGEVQDKPDVALRSEIPSMVGELENDAGYITASAIPSNVGAFQNDVGYLTSVSWGEVQDKPDVALKSDLPSKVSELDNDVGYITASALPSKVSELENDSGFITLAQVPPVPSNLSEYNNDVGFITASAIPSNVGAFTNDVGYLTSTSSAFTEKRDKTDLAYKVGFDKDNLDKVVKFVVEYVDDNNQNVTATLDKYDGFTQTWTGKNTNWKVYTYLVGMEAELYFALDNGTSGQDGQPAPSQGAEDTSWNFTYKSNPATWTMVMTQNIALQQDFKNLRNMKDISYPASVDSTGMYTIQKFNVNGTEVAHFTTSGSTSTWDTNDPVMNQYEISTTDGTNFTLVSNGIQLGTFTRNNLNNGVVDVTYGDSTYTVGATFKQTTFALKDYVDAKLSTKREENDMGYIWYNVSDRVYRGIARWKISGLKTSGGTVLGDFYTNARGTGNPTYYTYWNNGPNVIWTRDGINMIVSINNPAEPPTFNISGNNYGRNVFKVSYVDEFGVQQNLTLTAYFQQEYFAFKSYVNDKATVSGIGCSTVTMSGVYADTTTFSYNVVVQPSS